MTKILMQNKSNVKIELRNFGVFTIKPVKGKPKARNPKTNKIINVPAHRKVSFKPSKIIKKELMKKWPQ